MTKEQLEERFNELLEYNHLEQTVKGMFYLVLESDAIDITSEPERDYRLPKIILHAIFQELANVWRPAFNENRQEAEKIKLFL